MHFSKKSFFLVLFFCSGLLFFPSRHAAADTVYRQFTVEEAYDFYGDSLSGVYYSSTGYKNITLIPSVNHYYYYRNTNQLCGTDVPEWVTARSLNYVVYAAEARDFSQNPSYLGLSISPNVHFTNCNSLRIAACSYLSNSSTVSSSAYTESFIRVFGQTELRYTNYPYIQNDTYPYWQITRGGSDFRILPVWAEYNSDTLSNVSLLQIGFNGCRLDNGHLYVYLSCPLVNDGATAETGVVTGTSSGSGSSGTTVNVDMTQTNSLLSSISSAISSLCQSILDGLVALFVPSEGFFDDLLDQLRERFSWYTSIEDAFSALQTSFSSADFDSPPTLNLSGDGRTYFGSSIGTFDAPALVLDWFTDHRAAARAVQSSFMWIFFLLRTYKHLPSIISGNSTSDSSEDGDSS